MSDAATGLTYLRARYYHPASGTFLTQDPVMGVVGGPASTFNPYVYVRGNPVNLTDPSGRIAPLVAGALFVGAAALIDGLVGGLVGGIGNLVEQLRQNGGNWNCLDLNAIVESALKSAIVGAVGGAAGALASLGFGALFAAAGYTGSAAVGALNVAASSAIGGQMARAAANGMAGQSYQLDGWSILGDAALGVATFGLFAGAGSVWNGARSLTSVAQGVNTGFRNAVNPLATLTQKNSPWVSQMSPEDAGQYSKWWDEVAGRASQAYKEARTAADAATVVIRATGSNQPTMVSAATSKKTGITYVETSGNLPDSELIFPSLRDKMPAKSFQLWDVANCAEFQVCNKALQAGESIDDLVIWTQRIRTGQAAARCRNCVITTDGAWTASDNPIYQYMPWKPN